MPNLRSSKSAQGRQAPAALPKSTLKAKKGRTVKNKVANATKVKDVSQQAPSTSGHSDVSTASLPSLRRFGSLVQNPDLLSESMLNFC